MNYFINILFGHLVGDFIFQNKYLAVKKGASNWIAVAHVSIYTFFLCLFTTFQWKWALFVFVSHIAIDRFSLSDKWLKLIKGRDLPDFYYNGHFDIPIEKITPNQNYFEFKLEQGLHEQHRLNYQILRGSFHSIVYTVVDATFHLLPLYYLYPYLTN